jgi:TRAP-type uncharacterized transport system fused permease subunit
MKFSAFLVVMPLLFVYTPLLGSGVLWLDVLAVTTATVAAVTFAATVQGYFLRRSTVPETLLLGGGTMMLFHGSPVMNAVGAALVAVVYVRQRRTRARQPEPAAVSTTAREYSPGS